MGLAAGEAEALALGLGEGVATAGPSPQATDTAKQSITARITEARRAAEHIR